jgi:hypothetical protein
MSNLILSFLHHWSASLKSYFQLEIACTELFIPDDLMAIVDSIDDAVDKLDNLSAISTPNMKGNAVLGIVSLN